MDQALRRGLLEVCVLKVLSRADSYGYQIMKDVAPMISISESTLYPILKRLESAQCLSVYSVEHNSRLRKYYRITDLGKERIAAFLGEWHAVMEIYNWIKEREDNDSE